MSDFEFEKNDGTKRTVTSKLKMLNFPVPAVLNFPTFCDQITHIEIVEQTETYLKVKTKTIAKNFPLTESFQIHQTYELTDLPNGECHVKIYGDIKWVESVNYIAKSAIQSSVANSIKAAARVYVKELSEYDAEVSF